jgi:ABC-type transport system substrate-binding protein/serine/threonine protein kinase
MGAAIFSPGMLEATMPDPRPLRPGDPERLGGYRLTGLLGEGGQGVVYLGERLDATAEPDDGVAGETGPDGPDDDTAAGAVDSADEGTARSPADDGAEDGRRELFAIKLLRTHLSDDARARRYFARELAAAGRVDPSFTARIVEADVEGRTPYIVSEYVDGRPLSETVRAEGPIAGPELHRLAIGTLNALIAIHQANVVHRDFKPSNVLLGADRPRVIDFGVARALDSTMSVSSGVVGTPSYMAPEQLNGQQITPAVDVFAWGATMVFAATGMPPFGLDSIPVVMHRILNADPWIGDIQSPLRELVWYCLFKNPAQRPTTHQLLARLTESTAPAVAPGTWPGAGWTTAPAWGSVPSRQEEQGRQPVSGPAGGPMSGPAGGPMSGPVTPPPYGTHPNPWDGGDPGAPAGQPVAHPSAPSQSPWGPVPGGTTTRPPGRARRRWLPVAAASAGVALVAAATVVVIQLGRPDSSPKKHSSGPAVDAALAGVVNPSAAKGGTLNLRQYQDFDSLDPGDMYYVGSWNFSRLYARSLLTYKGAPGAAGLRPVPDLATGPGEASTDLKTWTYRLRPGVKFEDGTPVTANDVRYAVARTFGTDVLVSGPPYFRELLDAGTYAGPYKNKNLGAFTGVTATDDHTVVFHLKKPFADFDYLAALPQTAPVPASKDTGAQYKNHPISTGPYKIETYTATKSVSLVRNPAWESDGLRTALPDRIRVDFGPDADTVDQQLLNGQADLNVGGNGLGDTARPKAFTDPNLKKNTDSMTTGFLHYVALSTKVAPFDNLHCRLAVQYAVDRAATQTAVGGAQAAEPATNLAPPVVIGRQRFDLYPTSTTQAKQELASCGKPSGFQTKIAIRKDRPKDRAVATTLQQALGRAGIDLQIAEFETAQFYSDYAGKPEYVHKNGLGMILSAWGPDYPTATGFFPLLVDGRQILPSANNNLAELNDSGINALIDRLAGTKDRTTREGLTAELDRRVMSTGAIVPLTYDKAVLYRNPRLTNVSVSPMYVGYDLVTLGVG